MIIIIEFNQAMKENKIGMIVKIYEQEHTCNRK